MRSAGAVLAAAAWLTAAAPDIAPAAAACRGTHWVASWTASPSHASTAHPALTRQTLRMVVAPHLGGSELRLRFTNRHGGEPATLHHVTVARHAGGAAAVADSLRDVEFGGRRRVTLPAYGGAQSDPVALRVRPFERLVVSVHLSGTVEHPTEHFITRATSYMAAPGTGDLTRDATGLGFASTTTAWSNGWFLLTGVDVRAPARTAGVVAFGDSITDGFVGAGSAALEDLDGLDADARYPDFLQQRLLAARAPIAVVNAGISGNRILADSEVAAPVPAGPRALARLAPDALDVPGVRTVIVLAGINDLGSGSTAAAVIDGLARIVRAVKARGLRVVLGTITPARGTLGLNGYGSAAVDAARREVNRWIRAASGAHAVADFDRALRDPDDPGRLDPRYDSSDHLHPSAAGYRAMADAVRLSALRPRAGSCSAGAVSRTAGRSPGA